MQSSKLFFFFLMNHKLQAYGYLCKPETRLHQQTKGVDGNTAHDADDQQPAGLDLFADQGVHQHHDAKVQKVRQNAVQHIMGSKYLTKLISLSIMPPLSLVRYLLPMV